ncbi:MAG: hypothetical protein QM765_19185 [Myxococcales bacterium]
MLRALLIVSGCLLIPAMSLGAAAPAPKTQVFVFGEDVIESGPTEPDCRPIDTRRPGKFGKLINVREDFKDKVAASVSEL